MIDRNKFASLKVKIKEAELPEDVTILQLAQEIRELIESFNPKGEPDISHIRTVKYEDHIYAGWRYTQVYSVPVLPEEEYKNQSYTLDHFIFTVLGPRGKYIAMYSNHSVEWATSPNLTFEQFVALDHAGFQEAQRRLDIYRARVEAQPRQSAFWYELALISWQCLYEGLPCIPEDKAARQATNLAPKNALYHALLGELLFHTGQMGAACEAFEIANNLAPDVPLYKGRLASIAYVLSDLQRSIKLVEETRVLIAKKKSRISVSTAPAATFLRSICDQLVRAWRYSLERRANKVRQRVEGWRPIYTEELEEAQNQRAAIQIDPENVPEVLRDLIPLAKKWGVDDVSRGVLLKHASALEKRELAVAVENNLDHLNAWFDSFGEVSMPAEPAYFLYMRIAYDELDM